MGEEKNLSSMQNAQIGLFKEESLQKGEQILLLLCNVTSSFLICKVVKIV